MTEVNKRPILIVDDEPEILYSLRNLLRRDFEVHTAESGQEAIEVLQRQPVHVVMTDQRMPELTGVELLTRVQGEWPDAIRMVFTGYADVKAVIDAVNKGRIYRYITKPWDPDELCAVLFQAGEEYDRILDQRRLLADTRSFLARSLALAEGVRDGRWGALNSDGRARSEQLAEAGNALLTRLDDSMTPEPSRGVGQDADG